MSASHVAVFDTPEGTRIDLYNLYIVLQPVWYVSYYLEYICFFFVFFFDLSKTELPSKNGSKMGLPLGANSFVLE